MTELKVFSQMCLLTLLAFGIVGCNSLSLRSRHTPPHQQELSADRIEQARNCYWRGIDAHRRNEVEEAILLLEQATKLDPSHSASYLALGVCCYQSGQQEDAAQAFEGAAKAAPIRYEPHFNLGILHESTGHHEQAIVSYERAYQLEPDNVAVMENLARAFIRTDRNTERAQHLMTQALRHENRAEWQRWLTRNRQQVVK